ncbi:MAG: DUF2971 domain-containing protein [Bacteroidales bacterium]|nr:DUF2971 domain-containing protein [Bacteroidales bacterium]
MDIVYKYRDWNNSFHKNSLLYNEIYLSSPKDFNDPFDCRITPNFKHLTKEEKNNYINELAISQFEDTINEGLDFNFLFNRLIERAKNEDDFQEFLNNINFESQDKQYGIFCTSLRWDSLLMWSHYANCHKGFCIGYDQDKLLNSNYFGKADLVKYDSKYPSLKPRVAKKDLELIERGFIVTHTKSKEWDDEKEYRFFKLFQNEPYPFERLINLPDEFIVEIVLGINISESGSDEIIRICKEKKIKVYKAIKKEFEFNIDRIPFTIY